MGTYPQAWIVVGKHTYTPVLHMSEYILSEQMEASGVTAW